MTAVLGLDVARWAAIVGEDPELLSGDAAGSEVIPAQLRRRLSRFPRQIARCALPLIAAAPSADVVFASRMGDLAGTVKMLQDIAIGEILSPAQFSMSVHNAAPGVLSLCTPEPGDHTAIGAKGETLRMALFECWSRLQDGESARCVVVFGEDTLPDVYAGADDGSPPVFLAFEATLAHGERDSVAVAPGREGARALAEALASGVRRIRLAPATIDRIAA